MAEEPAQQKTHSHANPHIPKAAIIALVVVVVAGVALWLLIQSGKKGRSQSFTGYVVSDDIYMSSPVGGTLLDLSVKRGQRVAAGDALFRVDPTVRAAEADQARAKLNASQAQVDQQEATLAHAKADLAAAQADANRSEADLKRLTAAQREKPGAVAQLDVDQAQASFQSAVGKADAARAQVAATSAAIAAAKADVAQSRAGITSAERELSDLAPKNPRAGRVEDVMFKPGESVPANSPIVSIVPDGEVKVRFYIPQALVNAYKPGRRVAIHCDGCATGMSATIDFVAAHPEYTPPIIYSLDARQKLVFMVEAVPSDPAALIPGQPMDVAANNVDLPAQ